MAQGLRKWGFATIVCWHYNGTGVSENRGRQQQFVGTTILQRQAITVCWHYHSTAAGYNSLLLPHVLTVDEWDAKIILTDGS